MSYILSRIASAHSEQRDQRIRQVVAYKSLKKDGKSLNFQSQKVVAVTYRRCSFTRGSNCEALTRKILVFWIGGCLWEVVAYGRWSLMRGSCTWGFDCNKYIRDLTKPRR